ncbi:hypothetical protein GOODEAATRI_010174 [Goodea atripinnis]|uniref:Uncharacterized protein n=1 Tax=Goodea atripinnis TaxID=208336 RepID=A0ABV0P380_9TELE
MFVEIWLHHYSLDMYQKLQSPQVKAGVLHVPVAFCFSHPLHAACHLVLVLWEEHHPEVPISPQWVSNQT